MKNNSSIRLMTLLKLLSDQLDANDQRRLEKEIGRNSDASARLQHVRKAAGATKTLRLVSKGKSDDEEFQLQQIAGFLDGTLTSDEEIAFESECWTSPRLLNDVIVLYQTGLKTGERHHDKVNHSESPNEHRMRERLLDLFPAEPPVAPRINGTKTSLSAPRPKSIRTAERHEQAVGQPAAILNPPEPSKTTDHDGNKRSKARIISLAIAVMVGIIVVSIVVANWNSFRTPPTVVVESPQENEVQNTPSPSPEIVGSDNNNSPPDQPEPESPERIVDVENPIDLPRNPGSELPEIPGPENPEKRTPKALVDTDKTKKVTPPDSVDPNTPESKTKPLQLALSWDRVEGLVATRADDSDVWTGALAVDQLNNNGDPAANNNRVNIRQFVGLECKVLSRSWAQASLDGLGTWTINGNTDIDVTPTAGRRFDRQSENGSQLDSAADTETGARVVLSTGSLAIANADVGSVILIATSTRNWNVRITEPGTVFVVEHGANSRLLVQKGSVIANGSKLAAKQQLVQVKDGKLERLVNRETIKWLKNPPYKFPNKQLSDQWLASRDLFKDLSRPDAISLEDQPLVRAAFATIDPPGQAKTYLANVLPSVRAEGIRWLVAYGRDRQRLRQLADQLATELETPGFRTTIPRLVLATQTKRWPPQADAELLLTGLQSPNVSVRRLSHGLLVHLFGRLEAYNSETDFATRSVQSRKWHAAVAKLYRRVENARRK